MTSTVSADFAALQLALPELAPGDELVLREDDGKACALLRQKRGTPRNFVFENGSLRELSLRDDAALPAAALCADETALCDALRPAFGDVREPQLVAWRPSKRAVLRMRRGDETVYVKLLDKKTWKRAKAALERMQSIEAPLRFALPSALAPDLCAYVASGVSGTALHDTLAAGQSPSWRIVDRAVRALACAACPDDLPRHDFASARDAAVKMLTKARNVDPRCAEIAERVAKLAGPRQSHEGFVHGDLHDKQLFLDGSIAWLIDLEGAGRGDANFDLVNLAEHLRLRALQRTGKDDGLCDAMLDRFAIAREVRMAWSACIRARLFGVYAMRPRQAALANVLHSDASRALSH